MIKRLRIILCVLLISAACVIGAGFADSLEYVVDRESLGRYYQHLEVSPDESTYVEGEYNSKLPIVSIDTYGQEIPGLPVVGANSGLVSYTVSAEGENTIVSNIKIYDTPDEYNRLSDEPAIESSIDIRVRGNSSRHFDKSSYKIAFVDEAGLESNVDVMGMGAYDEWALYGPFLDKTMMRNYIYLNLYGEIDHTAPDMRYCEVFIDGEYSGLYLMMETIAADNDRVSLTSYTTRSDVTSYIIRADRLKTQDPHSILNAFSDYTLNLNESSAINVVYPGRTNQTEEFLDFIEQDLNEFEKALYSFDFADPEKGYRAYIDVDSFVDYYIFNEFAVINDFGNFSTYLYKDMGGKLTIGPVWDFNNAAALYFGEVPGIDAQGYLYVDRVWFSMLLKDEYFVEKVISRYKELRSVGILNEEYILSMIDDTMVFLEDEIERNYEVWGYSFDPSRLDGGNKLLDEDKNPTSYAEAVDDLKQFIIARGNWMDENIDGLMQYCAHSKMKQFEEY